MSRHEHNVSEENHWLRQQIEDLNFEKGTLLHVLDRVQEAIYDRQPPGETIAEIEEALNFKGLKHIDKSNIKKY